MTLAVQRRVAGMWLLKACTNGDCHGDLHRAGESDEWKCIQCSRIYEYNGKLLKMIIPVKAPRRRRKKNVSSSFRVQR